MTKLSSAATTLRDRGLSTLLTATYNLLKQTIQAKLFGQDFIRKRVYDYTMYLDVNDRGISRTLSLFGQRELEHKIILERVLKPGMRVYDIGANIGYYALMELSLLHGKGELIAIEPSATNVSLLKKNLTLNGYHDVTVIAGAISAESGVKSFHLARQSNLNTFHAVGSGVAHLTGTTVDVHTYTVTELAEQYGAPDLIRMDVEGHEVEVIRGMLAAMTRKQFAPMILFETHPTRYSAEHDMVAILRELFALGYRVPLLASSWQRGTDIISRRGYQGSQVIKTDGVERVIFHDIAADDAIDFICHDGGARTVLLAPLTLDDQQPVEV